MGLSTAPNKGADGWGCGTPHRPADEGGHTGSMDPHPPHPIAVRTKEAHAAQETRRGPDLG